ncbi:MAG TPA: hypothetical protein V6D25_22075 [Leptolyngbyaceae cyanobacterium]
MLDEPITIAGKDGDDAPKYLEKQINNVLSRLEEIQQQSSNNDEREE